MKRYNEFIFVRCGDKKTAEEVGAKSPPEVIFFNPDGEEILRMGIRDLSSLQRAMDMANQKYGPKEIAWAEYDAAALQAASGKLVVLAFADDSKDCQSTLKALEDRALVKFHEKIVFLKTAYRKDSEEAKLWGVSAAPAVVLIDPTKEAGSKAVIERLVGKRNWTQFRKPIERAVKALDKSGR